MRNIIRVFKTDIKRISRNVVAVVMLTGLAVVPCLYAWFNILSNWDPYGSDATSNLSIAVFSEDKGKALMDFSVNVGDKLVSELHANDDIGWQFPASEEETMDGVDSGKYYAALIIPEDFTEDLMSFVNGKPESPAIQYYGNSKKNAIATKITSKVKTAIQRKINEAFLETITLYSTEAADSLLGNDGFASEIVDSLVSALDNMDKRLSTYLSVIDSIMLVNDSASGLLQTADAVVPEMGSVISAGTDTVQILKGSTDAGNNTAAAAIQITDASLSALIANMDMLYAQAGLISSGVDVSTITGTMNELLSSHAFQAVQDVLDLLEDTPVALTEAYQKAVTAFNNLIDRINLISQTAEAAKADAASLSAALQGDIAWCRSSIADLQYQFDSTLAPALTQMITDAASALEAAGKLLGKADTDFTDLTKTLEDYEKTLDEGTAALSDTKTAVEQTREDLDRLKTKLEGLNSSEGYKQLMALLDENSLTLADFMSSPVTINEVEFYKVDTFGSEMSPFYTILAIWAGSLLMIALVKVKVADDETNSDIRPWQRFFGRYLLFFLIGQIQALITVLGDLFFIRIDCAHPVLFVLTGLIASFVFTLLMYSLTVAFRAVGQALVVVILVIQVAGSGGTFPVEMLPEAYRMVYRFLPFNYAINAMRECTGGIYGSCYLEDIGKLLIFAAVAVVIGLVMMRPFEKLRMIIDRHKEESGVML